jgi:hypothetical protein
MGLRRQDIYIASLLNPADHKPYTIYFRPPTSVARKNHIFGQTFVYTPGQNKEVGHAFIEVSPGDEEKIYQKTGCVRSHTPLGVKKKARGKGLGLMLYSGTCLATAYLYASSKDRKRWKIPESIQPCIQSAYGKRTESADLWWEKQVAKRFAKFMTDCDFKDTINANRLLASSKFKEALEEVVESEHTDEYGQVGVYDIPPEEIEITGKVKYNYCLIYNILLIDSVLRSRMILDLNPIIAAKFNWKKPKNSVLSQIDLSDIKDKEFAEKLHVQIKTAKLSNEQLVDFYVRNIKWFKYILPKKKQTVTSNPEDPAKKWKEYLAWNESYRKFLRNPQIL